VNSTRNLKVVSTLDVGCPNRGQPVSVPSSSSRVRQCLGSRKD
jgi:hypothetical protein